MVFSKWQACSSVFDEINLSSILKLALAKGHKILCTNFLDEYYREDLIGHGTKVAYLNSLLTFLDPLLLPVDDAIAVMNF
jgi:hypothetical protein